jgi:hypothetical protein
MGTKRTSPDLPAAAFANIEENNKGEILEAPSGLEPLNKGFADLPLSHLGTTP